MNKEGTMKVTTGRIVCLGAMVCCGLLVVVCQSPAWSQSGNASYFNIGTPTVRDLWVDPVHGSNANPGATRATALATVGEAWSRIPAGSTLTATGYRIMLVAGQYTEANLPSNGWMESRRGTLQCPVILQAADGLLSAHLHRYLDIYGVSYLYLIGLDFVTDPGYGGGGNVVHVAGSDHVLIRNCRLNGFDGSGLQPQETLKVNQVRFMYVENSEISGAYWFALDFVAVQFGHILNNRVHDSGDDCMVLKGGTAALRVERNEIFNCGVCGFTAGQGTGFEFMVSPWLHYEAYDLKFVNNVVHDVGNAGLAVRGGYNILLAYNTLYRVGIGTTGGAMLLVAPGGRSCDGDTAACLERNSAGGWGPAAPSSGNGECIPNRNVYVYNNLFYNPAPARTMYSHFDVHGPVDPPAGFNLSGPSRSDDNLQIRGNLIWNGPADLSLGVGGLTTGCQATNPTCFEAQLRRDNTINLIQPQLVNPAAGNFQPVAGGNAFSVPAFALPDFPGNDRPQPPLAPTGTLTNTVLLDYLLQARTTTRPPGAFRGPAAPTYRVSGWVGACGAGLPGVTLTIGGRSVQSGSAGTYSLSGIPPGTYPIAALRPGYQFVGPAAVTVGPDATGINFAAVALHSLTGRVTINGVALPGVVVVAGAGSATTSSTGYYTMTDLVPGPYTVTPVKPGYSFTPASVVVTLGPGTPAVNFTATP